MWLPSIIVAFAVNIIDYRLAVITVYLRDVLIMVKI